MGNRMGRKHSEATKNKIRLAHLGVKESEAKIAKIKMNKIFAGKNNPMYGRKQVSSTEKETKFSNQTFMETRGLF